MTRKKALILGVAGQDGSYLAELLVWKGYEVHGLIRRNSANYYPNIEHLRDQIALHWGDVENEHHICSIMANVKPDEIYNLAAQSDVGISFQCPEYTGDVTGLGTTRVLEAMRTFAPGAKFYHASTSELFGSAPPPQNEQTPMVPNSPYAAAKLYAHSMVKIYREAYGLFCCAGILHNHESERRGPNFVTRKITMAAANIACGKQETLELGNLEARRDWGYSPDYVGAMWLMLQQDTPDDFVIGTGETHTVGEFAELAFSYAHLDWRKHVRVNPKFYRPLEVDYLQADITKARTVLGWEPKTKFPQLVRLMAEHDLRLANSENSRYGRRVEVRD